MLGKKKIVIIDYGSGNLHSVNKAFLQVIAANNLNFEVKVTDKSEDLTSASHIVLPGVGAYQDCVAGLKQVNGMIAEMENQVFNHKKLFLGICVGMQMLSEYGFENGKNQGLGWLKGNVKLMQNALDAKLKLPHMGWNNVEITKQSPILNDIKSGDDFYFVHSYHFETEAENVLATCKYPEKFTAIVNKNNIYGVQFHPEKSQAKGLKLLENFIRLG